VRGEPGMTACKQIVLVGMKSSGKTTVGRLVAHRLGLRFVDMDAEIERLHEEQRGERMAFREIFKRHGGEYFRTLEAAALRGLAEGLVGESYVLATGGGLPLAEENRAVLRGMGAIVFLDVRQDILLERIVARGVPAFFPHPEDPRRSLAEVLDVRRPIYAALADVTVECRAEAPGTVARKVLHQLERWGHEDRRRD